MRPLDGAFAVGTENPLADIRTAVCAECGRVVWVKRDETRTVRCATCAAALDPRPPPDRGWILRTLRPSGDGLPPAAPSVRTTEGRQPRAPPRTNGPPKRRTWRERRLSALAAGSLRRRIDEAKAVLALLEKTDEPLERPRDELVRAWVRWDEAEGDRIRIDLMDALAGLRPEADEATLAKMADEFTRRRGGTEARA